MAHSKWPQVEARLGLVEKWARDGLDESQIAKNLGISKSTLNLYKKQHSDFSDSIMRGKIPFLAEVENALSKSALGFRYKESKTYIKQEDDKTTRYTEETEKYQPPNVTACNILLKNKDKENWSDNPQKLDMDRELLELKKKTEGLNNF
jgi:transcriptional regulator with XRE-family HTH domain